MQEPELLSAYDYLKSYDVLKNYSDHIGVIMDAQAFLERGMEYRIAVSNFTELVPLATFSHARVVKANGTIDTTAIAEVQQLAARHNMHLIGTPLVWHRQQNTTYLNAQLAPNVIRPEGDDGGYCLKMTNTSASSSMNDAQVAYTFAKTPQVEPGIAYKLKLWVRGTAEGKVQVQTYSNGKGSRFSPDITVTKEWTKVETINTMASGIKGLTSILFSLGQYVGTLYVDNIEIVEWNTGRQKEVGKNLNTVNTNLDDAEQTAASTTVHIDANGSLEDVGCSELGEGYDEQATYVEKTDVEKQDILTREMQRYIASVMTAGRTTTSDWIVVKEPLADVTDDASLFFWQQYLGSADYAVTAFKEAAQHTSGRLYIDESDLTKCGQLAAYVSTLEGKGAKVDGIAIRIEGDIETTDVETIAQVFKSLAATGKYIRISDLQVGIGVATDEVTELQLQQQAKLLGSILQAYYTCVPEAQRGGIMLHQTIDNSQPLGLWNSNYQRKHAYGSVAAGLK